MLTLDPSSVTYRGPYHRAHSRRVRALVLIAASTDDRLGDDIRLWHKCEVPTGFELVCFPGQTGSGRPTVKMAQLTQHGRCKHVDSQCRT